MNKEIDYIRTVFSEYKEAEIIKLNEGSNENTFIIDQNIIVKIPKSENEVLSLEKEKIFIENFSTDYKTILPEFIRRSYSTPYLYEYKKVNGLNGRKFINKEIHPKAIKQLGEFLADLHTKKTFIKFKEMFDEEPLNIDILQLKSDHYKDILIYYLGNNIVSQLDQFYDFDWSNTLRRSKEELRLCHNDIKGEHIFLNNSADKITGIIDWTDIKITEIYRDFAGLIIWKGKKILKNLLKVYPNKDVDLKLEFEAAKYYSIHKSIIHLGMTLHKEWNAPQDLIFNQFKNATEIKL